MVILGGVLLKGFNVICDRFDLGGGQLLLEAGHVALSVGDHPRYLFDAVGGAANVVRLELAALFGI